MLKSLSTIILVVASFTAQAAIVTFDDRTDFHNAAGTNLVFEGFNNAYDTDITVIPAGGFSDFWMYNNPLTEGSHALGLIERSANTFAFSAPVFAFGFDYIEINRGALDYSDSDGNSIIGALPVTDFVNGSSEGGFFGVLSDTAISSFTIGTGSDGSGSVFFIDSLEFTATVPEPGSLALFAIVLACFGLRKRSTL
ncbi:PEP-CTERM sorting domain-containing protein [Aliiglaciecola litoralis]|uniref:Ice-binding protein C-terminal domain-containing protein n=1 Tax=Aliiglaciecola litoralis TaxID=582857 RepID=A0ABP3X3Q9_9ALTE